MQIQTKTNRNTKEIQTNINWNPNPIITHFRTSDQGPRSEFGPQVRIHSDLAGSEQSDSDLGPDQVRMHSDLAPAKVHSDLFIGPSRTWSGTSRPTPPLT
jgi:hypothetical protein